TLTLSPGASRIVEDVLGTLFGLEDAYGALEVESLGAIQLSSQTSTTAPGGGTFGQSVPAVASGDGIDASPRTILGVGENDSSRTNLVLANTTPAPVFITIQLVNDSGAMLASRVLTLAPLEMTQLTRVVRFFLGVMSDVRGARLVLSTPTPGGRFAAYASS